MPLSIPLWLPLAAAILGAFLPAKIGSKVALLGSLATLGCAIYLLADFDTGAVGLQWVTDEVWISALGIHYKLGLDGLNILLVATVALVFAIAFAAAQFREWENSSLFFFHLALAESAVLGAFFAQDLALFVVFFDLMLIPFYFLVGTWGERNRVQATTKLVIYTLVGSLLMLAAAVATGVLSTPEGGEISFAFTDLIARGLPAGTQEWIFVFFAIAFLIKMPAFPVHGWMPDGYRAMPIPVLVAFGAVLSKVAAYGFLKIVLPLYPDATMLFQELILFIALASILYGSAMAFTQTNARLIVGYSSVAQLGFITLGIFSLDDRGAQGAIFQMVNHAIVTAPLFLIVAALAVRAGNSEDVRDMGGIAFRAPVLAALFVIVAFANLAMPGSANFVGEFMILLGVFDAKLVIAIIAFTGVILASVYTLRLFIRAMHNRVGVKVTSREISLRDGVLIVPPVLVILFLAIYPQFGLERSEKGTAATVAAVERASEPAAEELPAGTGEAPVLPPGAVPVDPQTGQPVVPQGGQVPQGAVPVDPQTGQPVVPQGQAPAPPPGGTP